ncbi:hypothetical protein HAX54_023464 [Datura stramonium]|uniref:Uncharacterized protein n=1 Tax=Datura stramonium TaxID=4076 RepID=A0ABS8S5T9_DATST|nr:hypothetical protein [Datura stramonium]
MIALPTRDGASATKNAIVTMRMMYGCVARAKVRIRAFIVAMDGDFAEEYRPRSSSDYRCELHEFTMVAKGKGCKGNVTIIMMHRQAEWPIVVVVDNGGGGW